MDFIFVFWYVIIAEILISDEKFSSDEKKTPHKHHHAPNLGVDIHDNTANNVPAWFTPLTLLV